MFSKTEEETYPSECIPLCPQTLNYPASFEVQRAKRSDYMPGSFGLASLLKGRLLCYTQDVPPPPSSSFSSAECRAACTTTGVMLPSSEQDVLILLTGLAVGKLVHKRTTDIQRVGVSNAMKRIGNGETQTSTDANFSPF